MEPTREPPGIDTDLRLVAHALVEGRVVPFLGAGVNLCDRPEGPCWKASEDLLLPSGPELADHLAQRFHYDDATPCPLANCPKPRRDLDLARVAQYGVTSLDEGPLYASLHEVFANSSAPTTTHNFLASLALLPHAARFPEDNHMLIVTTNYDDLMEQSFQARAQSYDVVCYRPGLDRGVGDNTQGRFWHKRFDGVMLPIVTANDYEYPFCQDRPVILKLHGSIDRGSREHESFLITEDQYIEFLAEEPLERLLPSTLLAKLCDHHLLFLGYGLRDWNFRVFLRRLKGKSMHRYRSWAVVRSADRTERLFWIKNGVEIIPTELKCYLELLGQALRSLTALEGA